MEGSWSSVIAPAAAGDESVAEVGPKIDRSRTCAAWLGSAPPVQAGEEPVLTQVTPTVSIDSAGSRPYDVKMERLPD